MRFGSPVRVPVLAAVLAVAAACAPTPETATTSGTTGIEDKTTGIFAAGYAGIAEKYIDQVRISDIALEGMRGLGTIDPALSVDRERGHVRLSAAGDEIARLPAAATDDIDGWARLTTALFRSARNASPDIAAAELEAIYEAVFDGVLSDLDIFSRYAGAKEAARNRAKRDGFGGIGIRYRFVDGIPVINQVLEKTPAAKAGLREDDRITHVDGQSIKDMKRTRVGALLRGPVNSLVTLSVQRGLSGLVVTVELKRQHIFDTTVFITPKDGVAMIQLKSFNQDTARALASALDRTRAQMGDTLKGVVLDLRGNPGGLLKQSVKVADLILTQGHIVSTQGRHADSIHHYEAGGRDLAFGLPVVVLLDGKSASAAEVVAAALQDRERAVVIGTASYGKGSVQTVIRLPNDGEITLTWSRLVAPSGYFIHGLGVLPTICTSGVDNHNNEAIARAVIDRAVSEKNMAAWREPGLKTDDRRRTLREACPSQLRRGDAEVALARRLIGDATLYARALAITAGTHQARF